MEKSREEFRIPRMVHRCEIGNDLNLHETPLLWPLKRRLIIITEQRPGRAVRPLLSCNPATPSGRGVRQRAAHPVTNHSRWLFLPTHHFPTCTAVGGLWGSAQKPTGGPNSPSKPCGP